MENFCCCYSLQKGGKIIGYLCSIFSVIIILILLIYIASDLDEVVGEITQDANSTAQLKQHSTTTKAIAAIYFVVALILLVSSVLLIKGTHKESKNLLKPFMFMMSLSIVILLFSTFSSFGYRYVTLILIILLIIFIYFLISTCSLYNKYSKLYNDDEETDYDNGMKNEHDSSAPSGHSLPPYQQPYPMQDNSRPAPPAYPGYNESPMLYADQSPHAIQPYPQGEPYQPSHTPPYPAMPVPNNAPYPQMSNNAPYPPMSNTAPYPAMPVSNNPAYPAYPQPNSNMPYPPN